MSIDTPLYCDDCTHNKFMGMVRVGSDSQGGGLEKSWSCKKGHDQDNLRRNQRGCSDCNSDFFDY